MTLPSTYTKITFPSTNDAVIVPTESNNLNIANEDVPPINTKFFNMGVVNPFDNKLIQTILTVSQNVALRVSTTQLNIHKTTGDGFNLFVGDKVILLTKDDAKYELTITENFTNESTALKFNAVIFDTPIGDGAIITISQSDQFNEGNRKTRGQVAGFTISPSTITKNGIGISSWSNDPTFNEVDNTTLPTSQAVKEYVLSKKDIIETELIKVNDDVINKSAFLHDDGLRFTRIEDGSEMGQINYDGVDTITFNSNGGSSTGATRLDFQVNSVSKMVINNEGKVGIGTTSPGYKLSVAGTIQSNAGTITGYPLLEQLRMMYDQDGNYWKFETTAGPGADLLISQNATPFLVVKSGSGRVGIGTTSPAQKLDVVGKISLKDAGDSIFLGYQAGLNDDASANRNVGVGYQALYFNTTGANNSAVGYQALRSNTTGASNTAHGYQALYYNTTGTLNTATGTSALTYNTADSNTANGFGALYNNTTGANNSAFGRQALYLNTTGANNTAIGIFSSQKNTTGVGNAALGYAALYENTTGGSNTAIGREAGRFIADGTTANTSTSNSVFLGYNTKALAIGQTNQIVIGESAVGLGSNTAILGNSSITKTQLQGNVGIGTASPDNKLVIQQSEDDLGIKINGYDDKSVEYLKGYIDSAGASWIRSSNILRFIASSRIEFRPNTLSGLELKNSGTEVQFISYRAYDCLFELQNRLSDSPTRQIKFKGSNAYTSATANKDGGDIILVGGKKASDGSDGNVILCHDGTDLIGKVGIGTTSPKNKLDIVGSLGRGIPVTKEANFTVAATENWLIINGLETIEIGLPSASDFSGRELMIKNIAAFTVISDATNVIGLNNNEKTNAILPATAGSWCTLVCDGSEWITMSGSAEG